MQGSYKQLKTKQMNTKTKLQQLEERADELYSMIENLPSLSYERGEFIAELEDIDLEIEELENKKP